MITSFRFAKVYTRHCGSTEADVYAVGEKLSGPLQLTDLDPIHAAIIAAVCKHGKVVSHAPLTDGDVVSMTEYKLV